MPLSLSVLVQKCALILILKDNSAGVQIDPILYILVTYAENSVTRSVDSISEIVTNSLTSFIKKPCHTSNETCKSSDLFVRGQV